MSDTAPNRLNTVVNVGILATLLVLLLGPTGPVGRWYAGWRAMSEQRALVESSWDDLISQASVIASQPPPSDTIVMFTDYQCPFCRSVEPTLVRAVAGGLAIALLHLPLDQIHPLAREAANAAVCAEEQGMFREIHHGLMSTDEWMDEGTWEDFVQGVGVPDVQALVVCMESERASSRLTASIALANRLGIRGTPAFVTKEGIETGVHGLDSVLVQVGTASRQQCAEGAILAGGGLASTNCRISAARDVKFLAASRTVPKQEAIDVPCIAGPASLVSFAARGETPKTTSIHEGV